MAGWRGGRVDGRGGLWLGSPADGGAPPPPACLDVPDHIPPTHPLPHPLIHPFTSSFPIGGGAALGNGLLGGSGTQGTGRRELGRDGRHQRPPQQRIVDCGLGGWVRRRDDSIVMCTKEGKCSELKGRSRVGEVN